MKIGVLISGNGSNLQALLDYFPGEIVVVISDRPALGLKRAERANVKNRIVSDDAAMTLALEAAGVELVCLAGFMRLLGKEFVDHWHNRLINIHPSLLPQFPGLDTHARALEAGAKVHGCTVHFVRLKMDSGPIIGQWAIPVLPNDNSATLAARVLQVEHQLYPYCIDKYSWS